MLYLWLFLQLCLIQSILQGNCCLLGGCLFSVPRYLCLPPHNFHFFVIFFFSFFWESVWIFCSTSLVWTSTGLVLLFSMSTSRDFFSLLRWYLFSSHMPPTSCIFGIINQHSTWQPTVPVMHLYRVHLTLKHVYSVYFGALSLSIECATIHLCHLLGQLFYRICYLCVDIDR